jgi:hypothetical protein
VSAQLQLLAPSGACAPVWAFGGSRKLSTQAGLAASVAASALLRTGAHLVTGCCTGADAAAITAATKTGLASRVTVLGAFGELGPANTWPAGACPVSAVNAVRAGVQAGAQFKPWAGGSQAYALSSRLSRRTRAVAQAATAGALVVLAPGSRGALLLARTVAQRGLPVLALPVNGAQLPQLVPGVRRWVKATGPLGKLGAWQFG